MKHIFIINSTAGTSNRTKEVVGKIESLLEKDQFDILMTEKEGDAERYLENLLKNKEEKYRIYACGGDGTLNAVVNSCYGYDVEITNFPIGSGNDFLKYFDNKEDFKNLENLINGEVITSDLIKMSDKYCINIFNVGFDGKVAAWQNKLKKLPLISGTAAYNLSVLLCAFGRLNNHFKLTIDGEVVFEGKAVLCAVANAICYGGGFFCAPKAKIDDETIDICLVKKVSLITFAKLVNIYKAGKHLENKKIEKYILYKKGKHVELEMKKPLYYSNDGEIGKTNKVEFDIVPSCVKFVVPKH